MKYFRIAGLILSLSLLGCGSDDENGGHIQAPSDSENFNFESLDMTGTWRMVNEERRIRIDTGEYISSQFVEFRYVFEDTDSGVKYNRCWEYGNFYSPHGVKTVEHFYMYPGDPSDTGFTIQDKDTLKKVTTYENEWEPEFSFESIQTLTRISSDVEIDSGTFILNGPISIEEYNHTCTWQVSSNVGESRTLELLVPYDNGNINFHFRLIGEISVGSYYYNEYWESEKIYMDIGSTSDAFWNIVGSNILGAEDVTINIIESTDTKLSGTFSLLGQDDERYSGEFEIFMGNYSPPAQPLGRYLLTS
ncbi:MAG: hypothetical protein GY820_31645 [Gammaproteobacteria bacterium]|nr:hypothetical protein [Gammaproteobacteria bacterium]